MEYLFALLYYLIMSTDLSFLHFGHMPHCSARVNKHFAGYYSLQYMSHGSVELAYDDQVRTLSGKWLWPAYPGPRIRFHPAPQRAYWEHRYVAFQGPRVARWVDEGLFPDGPQPAGNDPNRTRQFDLLLQFVQRGGRWGTLLAVNQLEKILITLSEQRQQSNIREPWFGQLLDQLDSSTTFSFDYDSFAEQAGMSISTLRRRFRQLAGVPLHTFSVQCRMAKAKSLLGDSNLSIKQISRKLGYNDIYFFSKQFKSVNGVAPISYRKSRQG
jgi:AraC-like DNA-binding protein